MGTQTCSDKPIWIILNLDIWHMCYCTVPLSNQWETGYLWPGVNDIRRLDSKSMLIQFNTICSVVHGGFTNLCAYYFPFKCWTCFLKVYSGFKSFNYHVDTAQYCTYDFMEAFVGSPGPRKMVHSMPSIAWTVKNSPRKPPLFCWIRMPQNRLIPLWARWGWVKTYSITLFLGNKHP